MNLFASVLTYPAPSANYRGESAENRAVIQKITKGRFEYPIISPEAVRNALRETLQKLGLPCNRSRLPDEEQLAVMFEDYPDADRFADDFFMGWLVAASGNDRKKIKKKLEDNKRDLKEFTFKRDSILRMNMAVALEPYRHDSVFTQSPLNVESPWKNADSSQLLHRETAYTPYRYPFAINLGDCDCRNSKCKHKDPKAGEESVCKRYWTKTLLRAIGELNNVAGNHARSYFEFAPASIVLRLTERLVAGFNTYGFAVDESGRHLFPEVVDGLVRGSNRQKDDAGDEGIDREIPDYPSEEIFLGGKIVKDMSEAVADSLRAAKVTLDRNPQRLLDTVAAKAFGEEE